MSWNTKVIRSGNKKIEIYYTNNSIPTGIVRNSQGKNGQRNK